MEYVTRHGVITQIDDEDFDLISTNTWYVNNCGYVVGYRDGKEQRLHRVIMKAKPGTIIDHANGDRLDNRKNNLRFCTVRENRRNSKPDLDREYKGVFFCEETNRYRCIIDEIHMGYFSNADAAANCYNHHATIRHGTFARLNKVGTTMSESEWKTFQKQKKSIYKGAAAHQDAFRADITVNSKKIYLGVFSTEIEAAQAYNDYVILHGLNRSLNKL